MMMASRAEGFGPEVKRRIMLGTFALSAGYADQYYNKALQVRRLIRNDYDQVFKEVDVLIGPTSPTPAFKLGEKISDPLAMYLSDIYTITANLAGIPGLVVPCGLSGRRPPHRPPASGPPLPEETLLRSARVFETRHRLAHPPPGPRIMDESKLRRSEPRSRTSKPPPSPAWTMPTPSSWPAATTPRSSTLCTLWRSSSRSSSAGVSTSAPCRSYSKRTTSKPSSSTPVFPPKY